MSNDDIEPTPNANRHGFVGYPTDHVYGIVDDPVNDVPAIMGELLALDVPTEAIHVYCCQHGVDELAPSGGGYGIRARIQRIVQSIGYEGEHLRRVERELNDGHAVIGVSVDDDAKGPVAAAMRKHGAHDLHYYRRFTIEDL